MKEGENSKGDLKLKQEIHRYEKASTSNPKGKGEDGIKERAQQNLKSIIIQKWGSRQTISGR